MESTSLAKFFYLNPTPLTHIHQSKLPPSFQPPEIANIIITEAVIAISCSEPSLVVELRQQSCTAFTWRRSRMTMEARLSKPSSSDMIRSSGLMYDTVVRVKPVIASL
jgi:hypothetical protein